VTQDLAERASTALVKGLKLTKGKREKELPYPLFFGIPQIDLAVDAAVSALKDSGLIGRESAEGIAAALADVHLDESLSEGHPVDVALFGRMVADLPRIKVDAAVQVAHALSTHEVTAEFDYFTTVDDMNPKEDTGAAMIDTVEFNSATYYRYATVGIHQLAANLSGSWSAAVDALDAFLEAFTLSVPSGHQNSFAHRTRPALVAVVLREDQPVNLVSAFEVPVYSHHGVVPCSIKRLADSFAAERDRWGDHPLAVFNSAASELLDNATQSALTGAFGPNLSFAELREGLRRVVAERA
jgi:CRISPR system Cascade subunit CasC